MSFLAPALLRDKQSGQEDNVPASLCLSSTPSRFPLVPLEVPPEKATSCIWWDSTKEGHLQAHSFEKLRASHLPDIEKINNIEMCACVF